MFIAWIILALIMGFVSSNMDRGFWFGFFLSLLLSPVIAIIIILVTKPDTKSPEKQHKYMGFKEEADREFFKSNHEKALDLYLNALFHLENDYPKLGKKEEALRLKRVNEVEEKITQTKERLNDPPKEVN